MAELIWAALVDPHRRAVLDVLRHSECSVNELVGVVGLSQPATSKHLRVLRQAGLVTVHRRAQQRIYAIDPGPMAELDAWLAPYRQLWNDRLDALGAHLDSDPAQPGHPTAKENS